MPTNSNNNSNIITSASGVVTRQESRGKQFSITRICPSTGGDRTRVYGWHSSMSPEFVFQNDGIEQSDLVGISPSRREDWMDGDSKSKFTIGIEIEKNTLHRNARIVHPLIGKLERDGSCGGRDRNGGHHEGTEFITNPLPLVPKSVLRNKVIGMFHDNALAINDETSPSNALTRRDAESGKRVFCCGGHTTIGVAGMNGSDIRDAVRPFAGILLAVYRKRLWSYYCNKDVRFQGTWDRHAVANVRSNVCEFRIANRVSSVGGMINRYEMFATLMDTAVNRPCSFSAFLNRMKPTIAKMYGHDEHKVAEILHLAKRFQKFIDSETTHEEIAPFVSHI